MESSQPPLSFGPISYSVRRCLSATSVAVGIVASCCAGALPKFCWSISETSTTTTSSSSLEKQKLFFGNSDRK